ncbi:tetratricopeptide repeat-containing sensor histidine kinase [Myroides phaeus]|uniref:tetratricopeptide repeat-containing sensor histidine kinase n=1 Tax=Myroides phaeus TaxID=702745 RepID=UPI001302E9BA|nr:tetratricopeptide repeat-containing sensor histidine kinase [Myroides phaeus]
MIYLTQKNNKLVLYLSFLSAILLLVNCSNPQIKTETDLEQLYAYKYSNHYRDSLAEVLQPEFKHVMSLSNTEGNRMAMDSVLMKLRWTRDSVSFRALATRSKKYALARGDDYALAKVYNNIGMYYHNMEKLDSTFYYYLLVENIYKKINDSVRVGEIQFYQARLLFEMGLYLESEVKVSNSLSLLRNSINNPVPFEANQLMALCLMEHNDYKEGERYFLQALELMEKDYKNKKVLEEGNLKLALAAVHGNLAAVYLKQEKFQTAYQYAEKGLSYLSVNDYPILISFLETTKAIASFELTGDRNNFKIIENNYKIDSTFGHIYRMFMTGNDLAQLYLDSGDRDLALVWGRKIYDIVKGQDLKVLERQALEFILLNEHHKFKNEVDHLIHLNREIQEQDNNTRNRFARIAYETELIIAENDHLKGIISLLIIATLSVLIMLILFFYVARLRSKNRALKLIEGQKKANESIYQLIIDKNNIATEVKKAERNRIAKDLHDGIVNGIFTIRFNLQQIECDNGDLKNVLIEELKKLEIGTRDLSHSLRNVDLFKGNRFIEIVKELVNLQRNEWNTRFCVYEKQDVDLEILSSSQKVNIYYIIKEALQNVNKHSHASKCVVDFKKANEGVLCSISDNGVGLLKGKSHGIGMSNMIDRASFLKTDLKITSSEESGTTISFIVKTTVIDKNEKDN